MKVKFINELKDDDFASQKFSSIPQEKYVEFFNEKIIPLLNLPREVTRLEIELVWVFSCVTSAPKEISVRYYYYGKGFYNDIRLNIEGLIFWSRLLRDEDELNARWAEFLKANLGIDVYKKLLAAKTKAKLQDTNRVVTQLEERVQRIKEYWREESAELKKWKQTRQADEEKFETDFADVLDENGDIIGL